MLHITGEMTIYQAAEHKELLLAALAQATEALEVDLSGISELDVAGLQVLMLAKNTAQRQNKSLQLQGHSAAVLDVFETLNVAAFFGDALVMGESA